MQLTLTKQRKKIAILASGGMFINAFMRRHIEVLSTKYSVYIIANTEQHAVSNFDVNAVTVIHFPFSRNVKLVSDIKCLIDLRRTLVKLNPGAVISLTPKAGFLTSLASFSAGVPLRIHIFTGQVWVTKSGLSRAMYKRCDALVGKLVTHALADSSSQLEFLVDQRVISFAKIKALGNGSISGVDTNRFKPDSRVCRDVRRELELEPNSVVILFMGRLNRDKGILDLARAFVRLNQESHAASTLVILGPDEGMKDQVESILELQRSRVRFVGFSSVPERYLAAADIFCLPSYREGFGTSVIEAAATGLPSIVSRIYGLTDAVVENETGLFHEPGSIDELASALVRLVESESLRKELGAKARLRALKNFDSDWVTDKLVTYLDALLDVG